MIVQNPSAQAARLLGTLISGRYLVQEVVAHSPTGALYRGEHTHMRKRIAIKVLYPEASRLAEMVARFEREAIAGANVDHPNVAVAKDFGALEDGTHFLVREYLDGPTLREAMQTPMGNERIVRVIRQIAMALDAAHRQGIVHRAIAPENIFLVERAGERDIVKLWDFGSAKLPPSLVPSGPGSEGRVQRVSIPVGPLPTMTEYASPEHLAGRDVDARSDLFSLGIVLHELLTGRRPDLLAGKPAMIPVKYGVPSELEKLLHDLLATEPAQRTKTAAEVVDALSDMLEAMQQASGSETPQTSSVTAARTVNPVHGASLPGPDARVPGKHRYWPNQIPPQVTFSVIGTVAIVVIVLLAIALRSPIADEGPVAATTASSKDGSGAATPLPAANKPTQTAAEPETRSARELREQFIKEARTRRLKEAVATLDKLVEADPNAPRDAAVNQAIVGLTQAVGAEDWDRLFELIAHRMGTMGPDILYYLLTSKGGSRASVRAGELLKDATIRDRGTPALRIAYELRMAVGCQNKLALAERAGAEGDERTLGQLYELSRLCGGRRGVTDPRIKAATEAIKSRGK